MSLTDISGPLPASVYGKADWQDNISNWREKDAEWLQQRIVQRYQTSAGRPAGEPGQLIYNAQTDRIEVFSGIRNDWTRFLQFDNIVSNKDDTAGVNLAHSNASPAFAGMILEGGAGTATRVNFTAPINVMNGMLYVDADSVDIKSPSQGTAKLTTSGTGATTQLRSDVSISVPSILLTAPSGPVIDAPTKTVNIGTLNVTTINGGTANFTGNVTFGGALTANVVNATSLNSSGTSVINGTTFNPGMLVNANGYVTNGGYFRGGADHAIMGYRHPTTGATTGPNFAAFATDYARIRSTQGIPYDRNDGSWTGAWVGVVYTTDPGAANAPAGALLLT